VGVGVGSLGVDVLVVAAAATGEGGIVGAGVDTAAAIKALIEKGCGMSGAPGFLNSGGSFSMSTTTSARAIEYAVGLAAATGVVGADSAGVVWMSPSIATDSAATPKSVTPAEMAAVATGRGMARTYCRARRR
jgi:hypothetical protein